MGDPIECVHDNSRSIILLATEACPELADDRKIRTLLDVSIRECQLLDVSKEGLDKLRVFIFASNTSLLCK